MDSQSPSLRSFPRHVYSLHVTHGGRVLVGLVEAVYRSTDQAATFDLVVAVMGMEPLAEQGGISI